MSPATLGWLARHEINLSWRDFMMMMTAGKPGRRTMVLAVIVIGILILHFFAWILLAPGAGSDRDGIGRLILVTGMIALAFSLMCSQAMESITRVFYSRSDLDLMLSSPVSQRRIFIVRIGAVALSTSALSVMLAAPAINVMAVSDTPFWLFAYPFALCLGVIAAVLALCLTLFLFRAIGARRTRIAAQIVAALVGALFVIGIQLAAIASIGSISRLSFLQSRMVREFAPDISSAVWLPARAAMGEAGPFVLVLVITGIVFAGAIARFSGGFSEKVLIAAGLNNSGRTVPRAHMKATHASVGAALRQKEWKLLARDHWLLSQTLMQVFYLLPPALMLWKGFGAGGAVPTVVVPVLVMASGQLAGGLAWLAISGEDAPQLVATAPIRRRSIIRAKVEAVLTVVAVLVGPIIMALALFDLWLALICSFGIIASSCSATAIQLWFRSQARRSNFRRRQTSSRVSTFAEAFSSIFWAGTAALWANGSPYALILAGLALVTLATARAIRPNPAGEFMH